MPGMLSRARRRLTAVLAWGSVAILFGVLLALWLTPVRRPPQHDSIALLLWARPQRHLFIGIRIALGVALAASAVAVAMLGRQRTWLLLAWIAAVVIGVVQFGERFAGMFRAWRMVQ
jgi:hypothetical protein